MTRHPIGLMAVAVLRDERTHHYVAPETLTSITFHDHVSSTVVVLYDFRNGQSKSPSLLLSVVVFLVCLLFSALQNDARRPSAAAAASTDASAEHTSIRSRLSILQASLWIDVLHTKRYCASGGQNQKRRRWLLAIKHAKFLECEQIFQKGPERISLVTIWSVLPCNESKK